MTQYNVVSKTGKVNMLMISIWSVSILTSITGLAISPSLPAIQRTFPGVGKTEIDMLISLPTLFLIPFVIIVGRLAQSRSAKGLIQLGTLIFLLSAIAYQFASGIHYLLMVSIMLGVGAGFVVPLAAQLPSAVFTGAERQRQMGICSGISNASQVLCTFFAGWLATINWHYSFWVYGLAVIPLLLSPFLKIKSPGADKTQSVQPSTPNPFADYGKDGINKKGLALLMTLYFVVMFFNLQIPISLPFLLSHHHISTEISGILISIFFLVQAVSAFMINTLVKVFRNYTMVFAVGILAVALWLLPFVRSELWYYVLAACAGVTGGTIEPLIWNKTSNLTSLKKSTLAFGWIMSANYMSVWATPYILDLFSHIFHDDLSTFPFYISGIIAVAFTLILLLCRKSVIFGMKDEVALLSTK